MISKFLVNYFAQPLTKMLEHFAFFCTFKYQWVFLQWFQCLQVTEVKMFHSCWEDCKIKLRCKFYLAIHILQFRLFSNSIFLQFNKPFFEKRIRTGFWFPSHSNSFFCSRCHSHFPLFTILNANVRLTTTTWLFLFCCSSPIRL